MSSPRAWGCFPHGDYARHYGRVFPTCVGVFPARGPPCFMLRRLPHVRGGVSRPCRGPTPYAQSFPRAWGCFWGRLRSGSALWVFPTCVGVFPSTYCDSALLPSLPHVRGGVSLVTGSVDKLSGSSPRAWGCFSYLSGSVALQCVFPTCVGVFLVVHFQR